MKLFFSYARSDRQRADSLAQRLRQAGNEVWLDTDLTGGQAWWDKILDQVRRCDALVIIVSWASIKSQACTHERVYATQLGKAVLPVAVEQIPAEVLPPDIGRLQVIDYSQPSETAAFELIGSVMNLPPPPQLPDPLPEPPPIPISHLATIANYLSRPDLTRDEQFAMVGNLESALGSADLSDRALARQLLAEMDGRTDLLAAVDKRIAILLKNTRQATETSESAETPESAESAESAETPESAESEAGTPSAPSAGTGYRWQDPLKPETSAGAQERGSKSSRSETGRTKGEWQPSEMSQWYPPAQKPQSQPSTQQWQAPPQRAATPAQPAPQRQPARERSLDDSAPSFPEGSTVHATREGDRVECSVFAPPIVSPGSTFMIQAFAHISSHTREAIRRAKEFDPDAVRRAIKTLESSVPRGTKLRFDLAVPGLQVDDPVQSMVWWGATESVQFGVSVPKRCRPRGIVGTLTVSQGWIPIGHIKFTLTVTAGPERPTRPISAVGESARRYEMAFLSYASEDRTTVLERAQVLSTVGVRTFQDVLNLEPGERWERSLYRHIDESDIVLLFWSNAAKRSKWVRKEVRYALERKHRDEFAPPEIGPVLIEGPPVPRPWKEIAYLYFNDPRIYIMSR